MDALEKGELERAAKYFKNVTAPDERTRGFIHLAQIALKQQKTPQAKKFLDEAKQTLKQINVEWAQMQSTVGIANVEANLDAGRGFQSIETAIEVLNRSGWGNGNVSGMGPGGITLRMNTYDFSEGLIVLTGTDFQRALGLAKRIQQMAASVFAQLAVCRGLLRSK